MGEVDIAMIYFAKNRGGTPEQETHYMNVLQKAASTNHCGALHALAFCYEYGFGVPERVDMSIACYQKANTPDSYYFMGLLFHRRKAYILAFLSFRVSALRGSAYGNACTGSYYDRGVGTPANAKLAAIYYRRASERGSVWATHKIGWAYYYGQGVDQDESIALAYFMKSASEGYKDSIFMIGVILFNDGQHDRGVQFLLVAKARGHGDAKNMLNDIFMLANAHV